MSKTIEWRCDSCNGIIQEPEDGWVQWISVRTLNEKHKVENLQIVHRLNSGGGKCQFDESFAQSQFNGIVGDFELKHWLGYDGIMNLLSFYETQNLPIRELSEMIKRLYVPNYDLAKPYLKDALDDGVIEEPLDGWYFNQSDLAEVIKWVEENENN